MSRTLSGYTFNFKYIKKIGYCVNLTICTFEFFQNEISMLTNKTLKKNIKGQHFW